MTEFHPQAAAYHDAAAAVRKAAEDNRTRFEAARDTYERFYSLVEKVGIDHAREALPDDAAVVDELERANVIPAKLLIDLAGVRTDVVVDRIRTLASESVMTEGSIIGRLRADLIELERFRKEHVDGIGGSFWNVVQQGHGVDRKEKDRMINRILAAWCSAYEVSPSVMNKAAVTVGSIPTDEVYDLERSLTPFLIRADDYPFDLVADLAEVRGWSEKNVAAVDALLARHESLGAWNLPESGSRFAR